MGVTAGVGGTPPMTAMPGAEWRQIDASSRTDVVRTGGAPCARASSEKSDLHSVGDVANCAAKLHSTKQAQRERV